MTNTHLIIQGARLPDGHRADLSIVDGRIAAIAPRLETGSGAECIDAAGCLVLPGYVDAHAHLDKTLWGLPWRAHRAGPTLLDRIEDERRAMSELRVSSEKQSARLLRHMVARGTTHVRTHVDVGLDMRLDYLHGVQAMAEAHREYI